MDYLILLSSIVLGAWSVFQLKLDQPQYLKPLNAFTGAFLLSLTFLHLLPETYEAASHAWVIGILILVGFYLQVALDTISQGIEHGHAHKHEHGTAPFGILAGLCVHAFIEATALGRQDSYHDPKTRKLLLWSIVVHNYPVSIALLGMLLHSGMKRSRALGGLSLFALMAPLGLLISGHTVYLAQHSHELMAIVIGIFMHIATTILFESEEGHKLQRLKLAAVVIGTALGFTSVFLD
jgi:zinc and cadmium transporter